MFRIYVGLFVFLTLFNNANAFLAQRIRKAKPTSCPLGYIWVSALAGFTTQDFCVAKYEARQSGVKAVSVASGTPWVSVNRTDAQTACQANGTGFDLISNPQWQTVARNLADTAANWSTGLVYSGTINRGHDDNAPASILTASSDDNDACLDTGQTCSSTVWSSQRRTHVFSTGEVIWDFSGNVSEWTSTDSNTSLVDGYVYTFTSGLRQVNYGNDSFCGGSDCKYGYGYLVGTQAIIRGGNYNVGGGVGAGVFSADTSAAPTTVNAKIGFRCIRRL